MCDNGVCSHSHQYLDKIRTTMALRVVVSQLVVTLSVCLLLLLLLSPSSAMASCTTNSSKTFNVQTNNGPLTVTHVECVSCQCQQGYTCSQLEQWLKDVNNNYIPWRRGCACITTNIQSTSNTNPSSWTNTATDLVNGIICYGVMLYLHHNTITINITAVEFNAVNDAVNTQLTNKNANSRTSILLPQKCLRPAYLGELKMCGHSIISTHADIFQWVVKMLAIGCSGLLHRPMGPIYIKKNYYL